MKRLISVMLAAMLMLGILSGCAGSKATPEISIFIWTEYLPQSVLDKFEEEYDVKVNMTTFSSIADMYAKVKSAPTGTYDVVDVAELYIEKMGSEGLLEPLDFENIPNVSNISSGYLKPWYDPENTYSVPYLGGVASICVNTEKVSGEITSYEDLFDPQFENSLVLIDDFRVIIGAVNVMLGFDYNETDPAKLEQTRAKLMELKPNVKLLDSDSPKTAMISGETTAGIIYSAEIAIANEENPDVEIVFPKEGQYLFLDSLCVAKDSKNKELAEKLINFILEPEISKMITEAFPYTNPNSAAMELMDEAFRANPAKNIPNEAIEKGLGVRDLDSDALEIYNDIWTQFTE
ncbi:MAG: PotD/PotF family extracellular solute-binding protein [Acetanaerobacterium sp.]